MSSTNQTLKFEFEGKQYKMFFRFPDRIKAKLSSQEKEEQRLLSEKRSILLALLTEQNLDGKFKIIPADSSRRRKGTGPITSEFHVVREIGVDAEGKSIFEEVLQAASVRYDTSSVRNSYEKGRQYAINKWFEINALAEDNPFRIEITKSYENRCETAVKLQHKDEIETFFSKKEIKEKKPYQPAEVSA